MRFNYAKINKGLKEPVFFKDDHFRPLKIHLGDVLSPVFTDLTMEKETDSIAGYIGSAGRLMGFLKIDTNGNEFQMYSFGKEKHKVELYNCVSMPYSMQFCDYLLMSSNWNFLLFFSVERLSVKISAMSLNDQFQQNIFEDMLVLDECGRGGNQKNFYCMSYDDDLLAVIQPYKGSVFATVNIDLVNVSLRQTGNGEKQLKAKHLTREKIKVPLNSSLVHCEIVCNGQKLIMMLTSPSKCKFFICCSIDPLMKLFTTKIECYEWFFIRDQHKNDLLLTVTFESCDDGYIFNLFSCNDNETLMPLKTFTGYSLGIANYHLSSAVFVSNKTLFLVVGDLIHVVDIDQETVKYHLKLPEIGCSYKNSDVSLLIDYNGYEVFVIYRKRVWVEDSYEYDRMMQVEGDFHVIVYYMPLLDCITFYGLCRASVLEMYSANEIKDLPVNNKLKRELLYLKNLK